jgi:hypothetical protein
MERVSLRTFRPVSIMVGGRYRVLTRVVDAAQLHRSDEWPKQESSAQSHLSLAIIAEFSGDASPDAVRHAILAAARDAHLQYVS